MTRDLREFYKGEVREVSNNEAHALIDGGYAVLFTEVVKQETDYIVKPLVAAPKEEPEKVEKEEFVCDECGYKAKNSRGLKIHQRVHKTRSYKTK